MPRALAGRAPPGRPARVGRIGDVMRRQLQAPQRPPRGACSYGPQASVIAVTCSDHAGRTPNPPRAHRRHPSLTSQKNLPHQPEEPATDPAREHGEPSRA